MAMQLRRQTLKGYHILYVLRYFFIVVMFTNVPFSRTTDVSCAIQCTIGLSRCTCIYLCKCFSVVVLVMKWSQTHMYHLTSISNCKGMYVVFINKLMMAYLILFTYRCENWIRFTAKIQPSKRCHYEGLWWIIFENVMLFSLRNVDGSYEFMTKTS